jgi:hypothetical protein
MKKCFDMANANILYTCIHTHIHIYCKQKTDDSTREKEKKSHKSIYFSIYIRKKNEDFKNLLDSIPHKKKKNISKPSTNTEKETYQNLCSTLD